jgi:hypothetical protein
MGRIGDSFRKIGRGIKKGICWVSDHVIRPVAEVVSNPIVGMGLSALGPVGREVSTAGSIVNAGFGIHDMVKDINRTPPKPPPLITNQPI